MINDKVINRLFTRLKDVYPEFEGYAPDWQDELIGLSIDDIKRGIERLDPNKYCPTPAVFREICDAPAKEIIKTIEKCPSGLPEMPTRGFNGTGDGKLWAARLKARYEAGERLTQIQIKFAEHVLGKFSKQREN